MELLAPAGSPEALQAAVQAGADAVYLGFGPLNARRNAKNFTREQLEEGVAYCHLRGVKVYLTLNTLLFDRELDTAAQAGALASDLGGGRRPGPGPGGGQTPAADLPRPPPPRLHPDDRPQPGRDFGLRRTGDHPGGPAPGDAGGGHPGPVPGLPLGDRGLWPRGPVHVLQRPVHPLGGAGGAQRQPGPVRPALPPGLPLAGGPADLPPPLPERPLPGRPPGPAGGDGGGLPEDRGADEAAGVRGGGHRHLRRRPPGAPGAHPEGDGPAGGRLLPPGVHPGVLFGPEGPGHVRHPARGDPGPCRPLRPSQTVLHPGGAPARAGDPLRPGAAGGTCHPHRPGRRRPHRHRPGGRPPARPHPAGDGGADRRPAGQDRGARCTPSKTSRWTGGRGSPSPCRR